MSFILRNHRKLRKRDIPTDQCASMIVGCICTSSPRRKKQAISIQSSTWRRRSNLRSRWKLQSVRCLNLRLLSQKCHLNQLGSGHKQASCKHPPHRDRLPSCKRNNPNTCMCPGIIILRYWRTCTIYAESSTSVCKLAKRSWSIVNWVYLGRPRW